MVSSPSLSLADVLTAVGLVPADVLLIRHPLSNPLVRQAVESGQIREYTRDQGPTFPEHHGYWLIFLGEEGNSARLFTCYTNGGRDEAGLFRLQESAVLADLVDRLIIDWGRGTRSWRQNGISAASKPVLAIAERAVAPWPGFDQVVLSFAQLEQLLAEPRRYARWHTALSSVSAVYLIVDTATGKQYVGSASGEGGLLSRWKAYVETFHGGNKRLVSELEADPATYSRFQFSILQILPRTTTPEATVAAEALHKRKLLSREFGLNAN